ncbi:ferric reduction oxidase 6 [Euphorbia peplus]|nr:ferric reduction oxidase 6 [Euphorbia peplus]
MDNCSSTDAEQTLLLSGNGDLRTNKSVFVLSVKWILKITMWLSFIFWVALVFFHPSSFGDSFFESLVKARSGTLFGPQGGTFLLMSVPILVIAILAVPYLTLCGDHQEHNILEKKSSKKASVSLWTFPLLVEGPLGVVSAAEFIGIFLFYFYVVWAVFTNTIRNFSLVAGLDLSPREQSITMLELVGMGIGETGLFFLVFLFFPVARGSVLLRLIDIPFEHAIRYHVWLGHLMLLVFTVHGICFFTGWTLSGTLRNELLDWKEAGIQNFAGLMALSTGIVIWVTSLGFVRKWSFELFYYTHHLYVVFIVLFAVHVGDYYVSMPAAGIFLFMLDRFLRFCQSRNAVDVVSARFFSCGAVELVISKPKNLSYNALSFIFIKIQEISWLQWHPFSVSSSPLDGKYHLSILIKSLGSWTQELNKTIKNISEDDEKSSKLKAFVEGPYGHQVPYHLKYENLILVAGGIGISPFLAILSDILHRVKGQKLCIPKNILVIWAVKTSNEIPLLSTISLDSSFSLKLDLQIHIYVTRQENPHLEEGTDDYETAKCLHSSKGNRISVLVGTGNIMWSGAYVIISTIGLAVSLALFDVLYMNPHQIVSIYKGFVVLGCSVAAVLIFGGCVILLWHLLETENLENEQESNNESDPNSYDSNHRTASTSSTTTVIEYGSRPNFKEVFASVSKQWGEVDTGVIVCGPSSLESSVAKEIRSHNFRRETDHPVFHFHSHSFQL